MEPKRPRGLPVNRGHNRCTEGSQRRLAPRCGHLADAFKVLRLAGESRDGSPVRSQITPKRFDLRIEHLGGYNDSGTTQHQSALHHLPSSYRYP